MLGFTQKRDAGASVNGSPVFSSSQKGKHLGSCINLYCYGILNTVGISGHSILKRGARETENKDG